MNKKALISTLLLSISIGGIFAYHILFNAKIPAYHDPEVVETNSNDPVDTEEKDTATSISITTPNATVNNNVQNNTPIVKPEAETKYAHELDGEEHEYRALLTANDPTYSSNWALQKINVENAWDISIGGDSTVIAVIDTGFALNHDDLKNQWYINDGETGYTSSGDNCWTGSSQDKSNNDCDDDNNGYVDDWRGWSFSMDDNNPAAGRTNPSGDGVSHGTETAGLSGASGNNSTGITTVNWNTLLMPLQALDDNGVGYSTDIALAIYYAVDNGANIINLSLGGNEYDSILEAATDYAYENGVVVVAAAGNCGTGQEYGCDGLSAGAMSYPALNRHVISVGATTSSNQRASFSSYGPGLDVAAPGSGSIYSTTWTQSNQTSLYVTSVYGTSYASPLVASLASLIKAIRPSSSVDDITALILASSSKPSLMNGSYFTNELGHGIIDATNAMTIAQSLNADSTEPILMQTGNNLTEHRYYASQTLYTSCDSIADTYCTIWAYNEQNNYERYLPYQQIDQTGATGWSWNSSSLYTGSWEIRAVQGDYLSPTYSLSRK